MHFVLNELYDILQDLGLDKKSFKLYRRPDIDDFDKNSFPIISIYDKGFQFDKIGIGNTGGQRKQIVEELLNGNGKQSTFKLKFFPLRDVIHIESPEHVIKKENIEYLVNYGEKEIKFIDPPAVGKKNIIVKYASAEVSSEIKVIRLKLKSVIEVWSNTYSQCDSIVLDIIKLFSTREDNLSKKNLFLKQEDSINLINNTNEGNEDSSLRNLRKQKQSELYGRRLNYIVELNIEVDAKIPSIRYIDVKEKEG